MNNLLRWAVAVLTPTCLLPVSVPALAQSDPSVPAQVCMAISPANDPAGRPLVVVLPADAEQTMAARGFTDHPCSDNPDDFTNYRAQICQFAADADDGLQSQFAQTWQVTPRELCNYANTLAGS